MKRWLHERRWRRFNAAYDIYVDTVAARLTIEFDWNDATVVTFRKIMDRARAENGGVWERFEFICDSVSANWRLKADHDNRPYGLRLADYRYSRIGRGPSSKEVRVNERLRELVEPVHAAIPGRRLLT